MITPASTDEPSIKSKDIFRSVYSSMRILLATDGSDHSGQATELLKRRPFASPGSEAWVLVVVPPGGLSDQPALREQAEALARREAQRLREVGYTAHSTLRVGHAAECILDVADEFGIELVVVGSRGMSDTKRFLLGSVSQKVMKYALCSVLVARLPDEARRDPKTGDAPLRILIAYDGSPSAQAAVDHVASLPHSEHTEITIVTALPLIRYFRTDIIQTGSPEWQRRKAAAQAGLESAARVLQRATPHVATKLRQGSDEAEEILEEADQSHADVIVLGDRGESAIAKFLLGSVSDRVVHHAKGSVWMVRGAGLAKRA